MHEYDENFDFPENGQIPEPEVPEEYVTADLPVEMPVSDLPAEESDELSEAELPVEEIPIDDVAEALPETSVEPPETPEEANDVAPVNRYSPGQGSTSYVPRQPVYVPQGATPPQGRKHTGLIVFAIILVATVLLSCILGVAHFLVKHTEFDISGEIKVESTVSGPSISTELEDRPGSGDEGTAAWVYEQAVDSVVLIQVYSLSDTSAGSEASGVIYSADGYIVTNDHIYSEVPDPQFLITTADGRQYDAQFVAGDARTDLAVLKIQADDLQPAKFGDAEQCVVGEKVVAIGNPGGSAFTFSMTEGIISALDRWAANNSNYSMRFIQIDAAINSGNSGGALLNGYGQVIGITTWKYVGDHFENTAFSIPSDTVVRICDSLISYGYVADRAKLGFTYQAVDTVAAKLNGMDVTGLMVAEITPGTPFSKCGARVGDMITHIDGQEIQDSNIVLAVLEDKKPGDAVKLTFVRSDGTRFDANVELIEDRGSSSYTLDATEDTNSHYGGEFNFPNGE